MRKIGSVLLGSIWRRLTWITTIAVILAMWSEGTRSNVAHAAPPLTIGFVYVGPKTDYGYNQAHA
jgi:simple sugar transport system substrate-binding protein